MFRRTDIYDFEGAGKIHEHAFELRRFDQIRQIDHPFGLGRRNTKSSRLHHRQSRFDPGFTAAFHAGYFFEAPALQQADTHAAAIG